MKLFILRFFILSAYYILGAFATTDIPRLMKGSTTPVNSRDCYCPICGYRIPLPSQLPVFAYLKNKGRCRNCKAKIPVTDILPELLIWLCCSVFALMTSFTFTGYLLSLSFYAVTKASLLIVKGIREDHFLRNLMASLLNNLVFFLLLALIYGLHALVY